MILTALLLATQPLPSSGGRPSGIDHIGYHSCEDWTRSRETSGQGTGRRMEAWVWGYLSAVDRYGPRSNRAVSAAVRDSIWSQLDAYCAAHQQATFGDSVRILVERLRRRSR